ncbi:winged helix-turn-helix transcriptional regulator [Aestuariivirga sp.]|uniref:winged helix-turn-helix transcriptional regulator n=1 Tax=Aestuariivirga sp. TaxID=2650926 RepID=UPI0039E56551
MAEVRSNDSYNSFCPVAKACEIIEPRWTLLVLCELWQGSTRFNEIRRGIPGISPTLLSKRLKDMERRGLVRRTELEGGEAGYATTPLADGLAPMVQALGKWAHHNIDVEVSLKKLDARLLMWNIRRKIDTSALPHGKTSVVQFTYPELAEEERHYWLVARPGRPVDLCLLDPGHDVDLFIRANLKAMTAAWMGWSSLRTEIAANRINLVGDQKLIMRLEKWMVTSGYARQAEQRAVA